MQQVYFNVLVTFLILLGLSSGGPLAAARELPPCLAKLLKSPDATKTQPPATRLSELANDYFEDSLFLNPGMATYVGDHRYDAVLRNDLTQEYREELAAYYRGYLHELRSIPKNKLSNNDKLTWDALEYQCVTGLDRLRFPDQLLPVGGMFDGPTMFALLASGQGFQPFKTFNDYTNFLGRISCFTPWIDTAIGNMRDGMRRKIVLPKIIAAKSLAQLEGVLSAPPLEGLFAKPLQNLPPDLTAAEKEVLREKYTTAIRDQIFPAYQKLAKFLREDYLPACRETVGLSALPDGKRWYAHLVWEYTSSSLSPDGIFKIGQGEVARITAQMEAIKREAGFGGPLKELAPFLAAKTPGRTNREDLIAGYQAIRAKVEPQLRELFGTLPKATFEIRPVEPFREKTSSSQCIGGSEDGSRPAIFYVNAAELAQGPMIPSESLFLHEAEPGHFLQGTITMERAKLPRFRRYADEPAYGEGWALYAETLGPRLGCHKDLYQRLDALGYEMLRARRLVIDTGLHTKSWTREQAIEYFLETPGETQANAAREVDRYIAWPGQALSYKIGQLQILALRSRAERKLGQKFDLRSFHDELLDEGAVPLSVLEKKVDRWIKAQENPRS